MYKFVVKDIAGAIVHTSVNTFIIASDAQFAGDRFMTVNRMMLSRTSITQKGNYIDVISV